MTHEFYTIIESYKRANSKNLRTVLATIVHVEGSSYRKEGTQMLIDENHNLTGALSGGCVEQEVIRQSKSVFASNCAKVFIYDGRYRLGCEGTIYILIELFQPDTLLLNKIEKAIEQRHSFWLSSSFLKEEISNKSFGTSFEFKDSSFYNSNHDETSNNLVFKKQIQSLNRLCIYGTEHDAAKLSQIASFLGWEVIIIGSEYSPVTNSDFPFAKSVLTVKPEDLDQDLFCKNTAVVVMSHNFSKDLRFVNNIINSNSKYIGLLGPVHRREKLLNSILDMDILIDETVFDKIHGPVGIPIGSETPEEIALSIMAEIIRFFKTNNKVFFESMEQKCVAK
jgi:xanthine dehydrogenase accessory factor